MAMKPSRNISEIRSWSEISRRKGFNAYEVLSNNPSWQHGVWYRRRGARSQRLCVTRAREQADEMKLVA